MHVDNFILNKLFKRHIRLKFSLYRIGLTNLIENMQRKFKKRLWCERSCVHTLEMGLL